MKLLKRILGHLWCLPYTVLGFLLFQTYGATGYRTQDGVLIVRVKRIWLGYENTAGQCIGQVMAVEERYANSQRLIRHELEHAAQFRRWGLLMGPAYGIASLVAALRGKHFYRDNCFEVEARKAE